MPPNTPAATPSGPVTADAGTQPSSTATASTLPESNAAANPAAANPAVAIPGAPAAPTTSGTVGQAAAAPERGAMPASGGAAPVASSAVIGGSRTAEAPRQEAPRLTAAERYAAEHRAPAERESEPAKERGTIRAAETPKAPARDPSATAEAVPVSRERIAVTPAAAQPRLNPSLAQGYTALQSGDLEEARSLYSRVAQSEPLNVDALLGLAYIAAQENRTDDAVKLYVRILQLNPRHAAAQGALIGLMGRADPIASESRLKQLIAREPSAFLHFVLGNLYADQSLWSQAQQAYFQAFHLEPDNPDYAYNLAVGLDHLRQSKLALNYYKQAEQLAAARGRTNFDLSHARERIASLSAQLD
jgi:tetratricopeptide (TPR) repeat protein